MNSAGVYPALCFIGNFEVHACAAVSDRFYRVPGTVSVGAGLGLSIVERIADRHGATFNVGPWQADKGFCANLQLPLHQQRQPQEERR